ncbi:MAG: hypothetical protein JWR07_1086 [Nevskia sp.]|nr:hypothetical protein [Nevskia sp.]
MNRFQVPPLPESPLTPSEPDPLLDEFRDATIRGKKIRTKPRPPADSDIDDSDIDDPDIDGNTPDPVGDSGDWGIDDNGSW